MISIVVASILLCGANAILFPSTLLNGPEPELLFVCPAPAAPAFGLIKCDYDLFDLKCTASCSAGFRFSNGASQATVYCNLFDGGFTSQEVPKCVQNGVVVPTASPVLPVNPSTSSQCVRTYTDCLTKKSGDYAYCDDCRKFATCAGSGFYVRACPAITVFDPVFDRCNDLYVSSAQSCKLM